MADMLAAADLRLPPLARQTQRVLHDGLIPAYLRVSNSVDCGGPPVADSRGRQILDAIVADLRAQMAQAAGEPSVPDRPLPLGRTWRELVAQ